MLSWTWKRADWNRYAVVKGIWGTIKERVKKLNKVMLNASKVSVPKKKVERYNKPYRGVELTVKGREAMTDMEKASVFVQHYASVNKVKLDKKDREVR